MKVGSKGKLRNAGKKPSGCRHFCGKEHAWWRGTSPSHVIAMSVFGFGYNGFGQIVPSDDVETLKTLPVCVDLPFNTSNIKLCASWSTTWALVDGMRS